MKSLGSLELSIHSQDRHVTVMFNRHSYDGSVRTPALVRAAKQPFHTPQIKVWPTKGRSV
jgi:hypothetical protein